MGIHSDGRMPGNTPARALTRPWRRGTIIRSKKRRQGPLRCLLGIKPGARAMRLRVLAVALGFAVFSAASFAEGTRDLRPFTPEGSRCTFATVEGRKPVTTGYQRGEGADAAKGRLFC